MSHFAGTGTPQVRKPSRLTAAISLIGLLFFIPTLLPLARAPRAGSAIRYAGWAVEAYPETSAAEMEAMVRRIVQAGANVIWIGHNNPGEVDPDKVEPGLSYAVYEAFLDPADPRHPAAAAIVRAQHRILAACRSVGVKAVLPVGYQMQMGRAWNEAHPDDLRRDAQGALLDIYGGGVSASFYAPGYRQSMADYYRWVDATFVRPYADVLLMLNLSDEPIGGDYSAHAESQFRQRTGLAFGDVGDDPDRQRLLGAFQSGHVVEYAAFSAQLWQQIHPDLPVTLSFDGAQARQTWTLPDVEALFRDTPSNLTVTFDAYPHDGLPRVPAREADLDGLFLLARSLGLYSARYGKPVWLWAAANSWGLSQASPDPGTVSDAVANGLYLALLVRQGGGDLEGIAYWNYNVKQQGLYNDTHVTTYEPDALFARVSAVLPVLRRLMTPPSLGSPGEAHPAGGPDVLVLAPPTIAHQQIGAAREAVRLGIRPFATLPVLSRTGVNAAVVAALAGWPLDGVRTIVVLASTPDLLSPGDVSTLTAFAGRGGRVVASTAVSHAVDPAAAAAAEPAYGGRIAVRGTLYVVREEVDALFEVGGGSSLAGFWRQVLGLTVPADAPGAVLQPAYRVVTDQAALAYNLGPQPSTVRLAPPYEAAGFRYDAQGRPARWLDARPAWVRLDRREYTLLWPIRRPRAWPELALQLPAVGE